MAGTYLTELSLTEASGLIATGKVSPLDLTQACIDRAEALEPRLTTYITRTFETALAEATVATADIAAGRRRGPLHGIPFAIKDLYETAGVRTTAGSPTRDDFVPVEDAHTIALLKQAGVVMLGKLTLHEWAMGGTNVQQWYATPKNPWDVTRITGGSSGGSGAAVAAGLCLGSLGTDTRGSIRIPASLCGITGLKPTYGRVSIRGIIPLSWSLDHSGPMARTVSDCALILNAIAGYDPRDPTSADVPAPDFAAFTELGDLKGLTIGVPRNFFFDKDVVEPETLAAVLASRDVLAGLGAEIREVEFPGSLEFNAASALGAESAAYHEANLAAHPEKYSEPILNRLTASQSTLGMAYVRERWAQLEMQQAVRELMRDVDLILTPTSPIVAPTIESTKASLPGTGPTVLGRHTSPFNITGQPTISVPCGFSGDGLPIGLQLSGRWWQEGTVIRAAHAYQAATDWHTRRPPL
ncbi:MAG TPA: amidase [Dehalococcoidia bacterium]|nr:amidase [Dehalococcoidia bacterium]